MSLNMRQFLNWKNKRNKLSKDNTKHECNNKNLLSSNNKKAFYYARSKSICGLMLIKNIELNM